MLPLPTDLVIECCKHLNARTKNGGSFPDGKIPASLLKVRELVFGDRVQSEWLTVVESLIQMHAVRLIAESLPAGSGFVDEYAAELKKFESVLNTTDGVGRRLKVTSRSTCPLVIGPKPVNYRYFKDARKYLLSDPPTVRIRDGDDTAEVYVSRAREWVKTVQCFDVDAHLKAGWVETDERGKLKPGWSLEPTATSWKPSDYRYFRSPSAHPDSLPRIRFSPDGAGEFRQNKVWVQSLIEMNIDEQIHRGWIETDEHGKPLRKKKKKKK